MHIPITTGLIQRDGSPALCELQDSGISTEQVVLELTQPEQTFVFTGLDEEPVVSVLRGFSAPVKLTMNRPLDELAFLLSHDQDTFNRWDAGQRLAVKRLMGLVKDHQQGKSLRLDQPFIDAFRKTLESPMEDKSFQAFALTLPSETYLADFMEAIDPTAIHEARRFAVRTLAGELRDAFFRVFDANVNAGPFSVGLPGDAVPRLTGLFEIVRYGDRKSTPRDVTEAVNCLNTIVHYCGESI